MLSQLRSPPKFRHYSSEGGSIPQRPAGGYRSPQEEPLDLEQPAVLAQDRAASVENLTGTLPDATLVDAPPSNAPLPPPLDDDDKSLDRQTVYHKEDEPMPRGDKPQGLVENFLFACCGIRPALSVLVAMDSFKGSLTSREAATVVESALHASRITRVYTLPLSDGGEGYLDAFKAIYSDTFQILRVGGVQGPMGEILAQEQPVMYDFTNNLAAVESAHACGFTLVEPSKLDPYKGSSHGVGQMIMQAVQAGARTVYVGVGGTATVDGGAGMALAMGFRFMDEAGNELLANEGNIMPRVAEVRTDFVDPVLREVKFIVGSDVQNALLGPEGAVAIYGPQKGVKESDIPQLDHQMQKYAALLEKAESRTGVSRLPGSGAGGGIAFALGALLGAEIVSGFSTIAERAELSNRVKKADLVITGEGTFDASSLYGKLPIEVGRLCKAAGTKCFLYTGRSSQDVLERPEDGISCIIPLVDSRASPEEIEKAKKNAKELLYNSVIRSLKLLRLGQEVKI